MGYYYIGQGRVFLGKRDANGFPGPLMDLGEAPMIEIALKTDYVDNFESISGQRRQDLHIPIKATATASLKLKEPTAANLALMVHGRVAAINSTNVTNIAFPTGITVGQTFLLPDLAANVSSFVLHDNAGSPATLVLNTDYTVDLKNGRVTWLNVTGFTQPFKASYTVGAASQVPFHTNPSDEYFLHFESINTAQSDKKSVHQLYRCVLTPVQKLSLKGDTVADFDFEVTVLDDPTKPESGDMGKFGRWYYVE